MADNEELTLQKRISEKLAFWFSEVKKKKNELTLVTESIVSFSLLGEISKLFKTEDINFGPEKRSGCEIGCCDEYAVNVLIIKNHDLSNLREND